MELRGAVALVTGGNGGLGQRICHALAKEGVNIAVMYAQSRDQAESVARDLASSYQINAAAFGCDITSDAAVATLIGDVTKRFGRIDILVNDAAYNKAIPFPDLDSMTSGGVGQDHGRQPHRPDASHQGGGAGDEGPGPRPRRQHRVGRRARTDRLVDRLCGIEGRAYPSHALHGRRHGAGGAGQLRRAGTARRHARDVEPAA